MRQEVIEAFATQVMTDLAASYSGVLVNIGHKLGLYRAMAGAGRLTSEELAERTGVRERYLREWLNNQRAGGYVLFDPGSRSYTLPDEHAFVLADDSSPAFLAPAFDGASSIWLDEDKSIEAIRAGRGMPWSEHHHRLFHATEAIFKNGYREHLVPTWIRAIEGMDARLRAGGRIADVGCGHGASSILMARAYPEATVVGIDSHAGSLAIARERARDAGVPGNLVFEEADARSYTGKGFDLICFMDALHDMGDPHLAAEHARAALADDGALLLVEPFANDAVEANVGPVARLFYAASLTMCTANALCDGDHALGAQAGPAETTAVLKRAGFNRIRRACETPMNIVYEVRP
jgi:2-polyprenyl-3-methyl-5-hydroxy-6-metoxy-1,4-benzoquinol methylase